VGSADLGLTGTAYLNCEVREFRFTNSSTLEDAHIEETEESRRTRGASEHDAHVLEEIKSVEGMSED
jgi:hypothetical protein